MSDSKLLRPYICIDNAGSRGECTLSRRRMSKYCNWIHWRWGRVPSHNLIGKVQFTTINVTINERLERIRITLVNVEKPKRMLFYLTVPHNTVEMCPDIAAQFKLRKCSKLGTTRMSPSMQRLNINPFLELKRFTLVALLQRQIQRHRSRLRMEIRCVLVWSLLLCKTNER